MTDTEYNGWTNYETWAVSLWMDNDEGSQRMWAEQADIAYMDAQDSLYFTRAEEATFALAELIKDEHQDCMPEGVEGTVYADLLTSALDNVNWIVIAGHLIETYVTEVAA